MDAKDKKPIEKITEKAQQAARSETAPAPMRRRRTYLFEVTLVAITIAFGVLTFMVKTMPSFPADLSITIGIQSVPYGWFSWLMQAVSWPGFAPQSAILTLIILLLLVGMGLWWETIGAFEAAVFTILLNILVKDLIRRPRPAGSLIHVLAKVTGFSFPSGHVMYYVGFLGFIGFLVFTLLKPSVKRTILLVFIGLMIALIGASRIYEGEHWASDALGAYLLGFLALTANVAFYRWGKKRFFTKQPVAKPSPEERVTG